MRYETPSGQDKLFCGNCEENGYWTMSRLRIPCKGLTLGFYVSYPETYWLDDIHGKFAMTIQAFDIDFSKLHKRLNTILSFG
jgi:hypothetical protein